MAGARAEGLGVGWVSIFHQADLQEALASRAASPHRLPVRGLRSHFHAKPELETAGWLPRLPIEDLCTSTNGASATTSSRSSPTCSVTRPWAETIA